MTDSGDERPNGRELNVLIVDNSPSLRDAMQPVLDEEEEIRIQGEAENGMQAIEMTERLKPDVILLADDIPDLTSEEAAQRIKQRYPNTRVIIVTAEEAWRDEILRKEAARRGSSGYVTRRENVGRVLSAIKDELLTLKPQGAPGQVSRARSIWSFGKFWQAVGLLSVLSLLAAFIAYPEVLLPMAALVCGGIFFSYGVKYYLSVAFVLLATRNGNGNGNGNGYSNGNGNGRGLNGLGSNGTNGHLSRQPFVSIHLPLYNEQNVVDRLMSAATSLDYKNYEVIVADDSTDETTEILNKRWGSHPRVKISHRENREGFKGGALQLALERTDPRAEFIVVLDADFVPPPDIVKQFLSHFFDLNGNGHGDHKKEMRLLDESVAVVQGYQWHVLNANENWITSGIRSEFSGSYVVERSSQEITGGMKMVAGSVFMIRTDVLRKIGWNTSITEDWQLTIRLYLEGYKVLYSPFIQAPAECVSTFKQLTRQRMRWAEGHTFNVKKYFWPMVLSPRVTIREKLEFFYFAPYYLQSAFFLFGTMAWLLSDVVLKFTLPYWSEVLGWSLVIVNSLSLPMMNLSGLFLERGASKSWRGILSFWLLSYLLAPYQAYAALKGLLEPKEGGWHRTHKTGVVTEAIDKLALKKHLKGLTKRMKKRQVNLGGRLGGAPAKIISQVPSLLLGIPRRPGLGFRLSTGMAICLVLMWIVSSQLPIASAAANVLFLRDTTTNGATPAGEDMNESLGSSEDTTVFDDASDEAYWYTEDTFPEGGDDASIAAGSYTVQMFFDSLPGSGTILVDDANHDYTDDGDTITIAHTASGTNRMIVVGVSVNPQNDEHVTGITWNGTETFTMLREDQNVNDARTEIWYLVNPTATSSDVVVTLNDSLYYAAIAGAVTLTGVDTNDPFRDDNGGEWDFASNPSVSVTSAVGDMIFGVVCVEDADVNSTTADTEHWRENEIGGPNSGTTSSGGTKAGAASSTSIAWTFSGSDHTAASAASIKPAAGVDIQVSAYHTNSSGGDATEIVTSSTVTITKDTANPLSLDLGAGAAQTFTSADPRRLRVHIDVTGVSSGGSFTLAYDSATSASYLATPDFIVPGASLLLALVVIFIPLFMSLVMRKQRLGSHIGMNAISMIVVLVILAGSVIPVDAAAGVFYLHDTDTQSGTIDVKVTTSTDDAEEASGGGMDLTSTDLELADDTSPHTVGMRFQGISVPQAAKITNAYIQFTCDEAGRDMDPVDLNIQGQLSPNADTFTLDANNITVGRPQTSAAVNWVPPTWVSDGDRLPAQRTPDLKTIIQEIVDQGGWASGNPLVIIIDGTGRREAESWDGSDPALAPELHIDYTVADPAGKYMNDTAGSAGSTMIFDGTDDEAYWYTELKYPTGDDDATIAAGDYVLNMYFSDLPGSVGAPAADAIFYSVGTLGSALYSGNASATSGTLTLASAADNKIGVGDEIRYGLSRYYITRRLSSTRFTIQNSGANGGTPGDTNITFGTTAITIYRAFSSLSAAQTGSSNADHLGTTNLVGNYQLNWVCYNDGALDDMLDLTVWTTGASNYIRIFTPVAPDQVGVSQRHTGVAGTGFRLTPVDATQQGYNIIHLKTEYVRIEGIEIDGSGLTNAESARGITVMQDLSNVGDIRIDSTIIHDLHTTAGTYAWETSIGIHDLQNVSNTGPPMLITNNIIYDIFNSNDVGHAAGMHVGSRTTSYAYNNTVYNVVNDSGTDGGPAWGIYAKAWPLATGNATLIATNNYVGNVLAPFDPVGRCYDTRDNGILTQSYNVSSDSTASGTGSQTLKTDYGTYFSSIAGGSENLHITNTSANLWGSSGDNLSATFTQDVDNTSRNAPWDISADEYGGITPSVGIAVSVYNTNATGGDPQLITSTTTSITPATAYQLTLDLGSGVEQTYSSSDDRRLRVHIDATSVTGGGSFTLAYDSAANPSYLETPDLVVPDQTFVMFSVAILIPVLTGLVTRKRLLGNRRSLGHGKRPHRKGDSIVGRMKKPER